MKMKKSTMRQILLAALVVVFAVAGLAGCKKKPSGNESTPLVISTQELDEVFNPFFATSGYDTSVIGVTQLGMLNTDKDGNSICGDDVASVVKDYTSKTTDTRPNKNDEEDYDNYYTTYRFLIKNGLKFSDGSPLTIKDVLFNLYIYLDPVYTGSATMYSVNIKGLTAYRTQTLDPNEQAAFESKFVKNAETRIGMINNWCRADGDLPNQEDQAQVDKDLVTMKKLFREELESDWSNAVTDVETYKEYSEITEGWQVFFIKEGFIELDTKKHTVKDWGGMDTYVEGLKAQGLSDKEFKQKCIDAVYNDKVENVDLKTRKTNIHEIINYWATAVTLKDSLVAQAKADYFEQLKKEHEGELLVKSVSGITVEKVHTFEGNSLDQEHDVLSIVINGVDPKAIYNFSFGVAPMRYYSTEELAAAADPEKNHFGVSFGDKKYMENVVRGREVPIGAGPYRAVSNEKNEYFKDNIVSYVRNDHFLLGAPKIKLLNYKVINSNRLYEAVANGEVHYADPNAQAETLQMVKENAQLGSTTVLNNGYGYIGINAKYVPDIEVRRAIMTTLDPWLCMNYYTNGLAEVIWRPMTKASWAYPKGVERHDSIPYDQTGETAADLISSAGWNLENGVFTKLNNKTGKKEQLKLTFTIAGEAESHPAAASFNNSMRILNSIGCMITVINDPNALSKLANGSLSVWAAAWSSTIDPDMFQVYHKDSSATSVNNWGYPYLLNEGTGEEIGIINQLSEKIEDGRKTTVQSQRELIYAEALDLVMDLAVEFPLYQRKNFFVWNKNVINESTLTPANELSPYNDPLAKIWLVEFN